MRLHQLAGAAHLRQLSQENARQRRIHLHFNAQLTNVAVILKARMLYDVCGL